MKLSDGARKVLWFVGLWVAGVLALGIVGGALKLIMRAM